MTYIGGIEMQLPIIIGAGACKTPESILPYMRGDVSVGAVCTGSYTKDPRKGNEGPSLFWPDTNNEFTQKGVGLNSFGMPNMGFAQAAKEFHSEYDHPVIASIAGFSVDEFMEGIETFAQLPGIAAVKANCGCPNTENVPCSYSLDSLHDILQGVKKLGIAKPFWLKLSPYMMTAWRDWLQEQHLDIDFSNVPTVEPGFVRKVLSLIKQYQFVRAVVFSNTLGNVIVRNAAGTPATTPNGGKAGLSGRILKGVSLGLVRHAAGILPEEIDVIGSGGVIQGDDAVDYFESGATAVCCTSGPFWFGNGPRFTANLIAESEKLQNYLEQHSETH